jgi:hypothetical protein
MSVVHGGVGAPMDSVAARPPSDAGPGEGILMSNADVGSMTLSASRFAAFSVPRAAVAALVPDVGDAIARSIPANNPALRLLLGYLATANDVQGLITPELQRLALPACRGQGSCPRLGSGICAGAGAPGAT